MTATTAPEWALSPLDFLAHLVIGELVDADETVLVTRCGHTMPLAAGGDESPRALLCRGCVRSSPIIDLGGSRRSP